MGFGCSEVIMCLQGSVANHLAKREKKSEGRKKKSGKDLRSFVTVPAFVHSIIHP